MAPDILPAKVLTYRELAATAEPQIKEVMLSLCDMIDHFRLTPESTLPGKPMQFVNTSNKFAMAVPLEKVEIERIWDKVPWQDEINIYRQRFDTIPQSDLRDAAFHLLWFANELTMDREPMVREKAFSPEELMKIDADQLKRTGRVPVTLQ